MGDSRQRVSTPMLKLLPSRKRIRRMMPQTVPPKKWCQSLPAWETGVYKYFAVFSLVLCLGYQCSHVVTPSHRRLPDRPEVHIVKSGWMWKRGGSRKSWKRRFLVLTDDGRISYYKEAINITDEGYNNPQYAEAKAKLWKGEFMLCDIKTDASGPGGKC